ncbi:hypothetical protein BWZ20_12860 [Winogradskyella sp. J14-2]|uniref:DUF1684 domain-containing protein n=1 Tax=Winogradskyella sp. J14-2 TaxID=1936080 RepID=UPI0009726864|nr:DUF1684 domain-containing protein [Winogradskyella sp. J14-2]APY09137.1 hypothetical protein BWZ20_12860 [Winogradskyella sp. J14-2]
MRHLLLLCLALITLSCGPGKEELLGETEWQRKTNATFKDASKSPLKKKDLKTFKSLDFFKYDSIYYVEAKLKRTPNSKWFKMKTTTDEESEERIFGVLTFKLKGKTHQLNVYQGKDLMTTEGFEDYLFLPFLDDTNGDTTYGGGRYIDLQIPEGDSIIIDFNEAYNPYCAYNEKYSCPIVPRENYVPVKVEAGLRAFKK